MTFGLHNDKEVVYPGGANDWEGATQERRQIGVVKISFVSGKIERRAAQ